MAAQSSILIWRIPWTEESGELQSMGLQRVRHDWATYAATLNLSDPLCILSPGFGLGTQLLLFSCSVVSDSLWPCGLQHTRLPSRCSIRHFWKESKYQEWEKYIGGTQKHYWVITELLLFGVWESVSSCFKNQEPKTTTTTTQHTHTYTHTHTHTHTHNLTDERYFDPSTSCHLAQIWPLLHTVEQRKYLIYFFPKSIFSISSF